MGSLRKRWHQLVDLIIPYIGVTLPRKVFIENHRLVYLQLFLQAGVVAWLIYQILSGEYFWNIKVIPGGRVESFPSESHVEAYFEAGVREMRGSAAICDPARSSRYNYAFKDTVAIDSGAGDATFNTNNFTGMKCTQLPLYEAFVDEVQSLFIPTYFEEAFVISNLTADDQSDGLCHVECETLGACPEDPQLALPTFRWSGLLSPVTLDCICQCFSRGRYFVAGVGSLSISVSPAAWVKTPAGEVRHYDNVPTFVRDRHSKNIIRRIDSDTNSDPVTITVDELLHLDAKTLDTLAVNTFPNSIADDSVSRFPRVRLTGATVKVNMAYHNAGDPEYIDSVPGGVVNYIEVTVSPQWVGRTFLDYEHLMTEARDSGSLVRQRSMNGIRVEFQIGGSFSFLDVLKVFTYLANLIVYMALPNMLTALITRYLLGPLSVLYYNAQVLVVSMKMMYTGILARSLEALEMYHSMLERQERDRENEAIAQRSQESHEALDYVTPDTCARMLGEIFKGYDDLDAEEIRTMQGVLMSGLDPESTSEVQRGCFLECFMNREICMREDMTKMFDTRRTPCCLEWLLDSERQRRINIAKTGLVSSTVIFLGADLPLKVFKQPLRLANDLSAGGLGLASNLGANVAGTVGQAAAGAAGTVGHAAAGAAGTVGLAAVGAAGTVGNAAGNLVSTSAGTVGRAGQNIINSAGNLVGAAAGNVGSIAGTVGSAAGNIVGTGAGTVGEATGALAGAGSKWRNPEPKDPVELEQSRVVEEWEAFCMEREEEMLRMQLEMDRLLEEKQLAQRQLEAEREHLRAARAKVQGDYRCVSGSPARLVETL